MTPPAVNGIGMGGDYKLMVQDRTSHGIKAVEKYTKLIAAKATESPESILAFTTYRISSPQLYVDIDRERAQKLSVPISSIFETMQYNLGSVYVNDFNILNRVYRVVAQAEDATRRCFRHLQPKSSERARGKCSARICRQHSPHDRTGKRREIQSVSGGRSHRKPRARIQHGAGNGGD